MGKEWPEYVAHHYGKRGLSLKFVHAHTGCTRTLLCFGVDLFTDMLTGCISNTMPHSVWIGCYCQTNGNKMKNFVSVEEMDAIGREITDLQCIE